MVTTQLADRILYHPIKCGMNELYILSAYATPTMLSWFIKNLSTQGDTPIKIALIIGMAAEDSISIGEHEGFCQILHDPLPKGVNSIEISYIYEKPAVHANLFIWAKDEIPQIAFTGTASFTQCSFLEKRKEILVETDPKEAFQYYQQQINNTIYVNHSEIEWYIKFHPSSPFFDNEDTLISSESLAGSERVTLSLLTKSGEPGRHSGLNWGQRPHRNPNEAYISLPHKVAQSGFFPINKQHFTAITDDRRYLILRVEQQNNKAITTPARNSDLGEYFRNRLGCPNGSYITLQDLVNYGRTDVTFIKVDDETFYMDFSVDRP